MNELTATEGINPGAIVKRNEEVCRIVGPIVRAKYTQVIQGRNYLTVQGAQAIASSLGYTSGTASLRHVEPTESVAGYWEATCTVLLIEARSISMWIFLLLGEKASRRPVTRSSKRAPMQMTRSA